MGSKVVYEGLRVLRDQFGIGALGFSGRKSVSFCFFPATGTED